MESFKEGVEGNERKIGLTEVIGVAAVLGVVAFTAKKVWDRKGPEIKEKVDLAGSRVIDSFVSDAEKGLIGAGKEVIGLCISRAKDSLMATLGFASADRSQQEDFKSSDPLKNSTDERSTKASREAAFWEIEGQLEKQRVKEAFEAGNVIDAEITPEAVDKTLFDPDDIVTMDTEGIDSLFETIRQDKFLREPLLRIYLEKAAQFVGLQNVLNMTDDQTKLIMAFTLMEFGKQRASGNIDRDKEIIRKGNKRNLADVFSDIINNI